MAHPADFANARPARRSLWIPFVYVGCMMVVFVTNGVLIWKALSTFPGLTTDHAYEQGRLYNQVLEEAALQDAIGLRVAITYEGDRIQLAIVQKDGTPLEEARIEGRLARPLTDEFIPLEFVAAGNGHWYAISAAPIPPGQWNAQITTHVSAGKVETVQRLVLR